MSSSFSPAILTRNSVFLHICHRKNVNNRPRPISIKQIICILFLLPPVGLEPTRYLNFAANFKFAEATNYSMMAFQDRASGTRTHTRFLSSHFECDMTTNSIITPFRVDESIIPQFLTLSTLFQKKGQIFLPLNYRTQVRFINARNRSFYLLLYRKHLYRGLLLRNLLLLLLLTSHKGKSHHRHYHYCLHKIYYNIVLLRPTKQDISSFSLPPICENQFIYIFPMNVSKHTNNLFDFAIIMFIESFLAISPTIHRK